MDRRNLGGAHMPLRTTNRPDCEGRSPGEQSYVKFTKRISLHYAMQCGLAGHLDNASTVDLLSLIRHSVREHREVV